VPLVRLATAVCITADGKEYFRRSRIIHFVLEGLVQPVNCLPARDIDLARVVTIGKHLCNLMVESEELRPQLKDQLRKRLLKYAKDAAAIWKAIPLADASALDSPRLQCLQRLTIMCTLVENLFVERRRHADDVVRDLLSPAVVEALVAAYQCTLPPSRQLFAQLSLRNPAPNMHLGNSNSAKALTSLLKSAIGQVSQSSSMFALLCAEIDEQLAIVSASKQALLAQRVAQAEKRTQGSPGAGMGQAADEKEGSSSGGDVKSNTVSSSTKRHHHRRTRTPSLGSAGGGNCVMLGVLDCIPHSTVVDPGFEKALLGCGGAETELHTWKLLNAVLSIEWLSTMMCQVLRVDQRLPQSRATITYKDTLRRLFSFNKSALLEICRFGSEKWTEKVSSVFFRSLSCHFTT
jgi:hypothetical protein